MSAVRASGRRSLRSGFQLALLDAGLIVGHGRGIDDNALAETINRLYTTE